MAVAAVAILCLSGRTRADCVDYADFIHRLGQVATPGDAVGVAVSGPYTYVADDSSGLQVIDVADPASPRVVGHMGMPGEARGVVVSGSTAYVAGGSGGLQVVDISEPTSPRIAGGLDIPGGAPSVAVSADHAYVAGDVAGFQVIDVSDPGNPRIVGSIASPLAATVAVSEGHAFVAEDSGNGVQVLDVTDPARPHVAGRVSLPGLTEDLAVSGRHVYAVGRYGLRVIDVVDPASPRIVGSLITPGQTTTTVAVYGGHAFVRFASYFESLQVIDITDPMNPTVAGTIRADARDIAFAGTVAYLADPDYGLRILDIQNPEGPEVGRLRAVDDDAASTGAVVASGDYAYVSSGWAGVHVVDVSAPEHPEEVASVGLLGVGHPALAVAGTHLYVLRDGGANVVVVDIAEPLRPRIVVSLYEDDYTPFSSMVATGSTLYLTRDSFGLYCVDVSVPEAPRVSGVVDTPGQAYDVAVSGGTAFVADGDHGLQVIDVSDHRNLRLVGSLETPGSAMEVAVSGGAAYLGLSNGELYVIDIANPTVPVIVGTLNARSFIRQLVATGTLLHFLSGPGLRVVDVEDPANPRIVGTAETWGGRRYLAVSDAHVYVGDGYAGLQILNRHCGPPSPPEPFSLCFPADAESLATPEPTLKWDPALDTDPYDSVQYTLYWSEDPSFSFSDSVDAGPSAAYTFGPSTLERLHTYYWKVRARDAQGFSRWSYPAGGYRFFIKERASPPDPFTLNYPYDQQPMESFEFSFSWQRAHDPDYADTVRFTLYWSQDPDFGTADSVVVGTASGYGLDSSVLQAGSTYYWRVRAWDTYGLGRWSDPPEGRSFSMNVDAGPPLPFSLLSPEDADSLYAFQLSFRWQDARRSHPAHTVDYTLVWSSSPHFVPFDHLQVGPDTSYTFTDSSFGPGSVYYWKVIAIDTNDLSRHSDGRRFFFRGDPLPEPFGLLSPVDGERLMTIAPTLSWERTISVDPRDVVRYTVFWSHDPAFRSPSAVIVDQDTTYTFPPSVLRQDVIYYWRVRAWTSHGQMRWSNPPLRSFRIVESAVAPEPFSLLSPADSESLLAGEAELSWQAARDPDPGDTVVYTLYWSEDGDLGSTDSVLVGQETAYTFGPLVLRPGGTYHWKVQAKDSNGLTRWSDPPEGWSFHVRRGEPPEVPLGLGLLPNPATGTLTVAIGLPRAGRVCLSLYDAAGREVAHKEIPSLRAGSHRIPWFPEDPRINDLTSGTYWIRLDTDAGTRTARWTVIR